MRRCAVCGSRDIDRVKATLRRRGATVRNVPIDRCNNCSEEFLDPHAIGLLSTATQRSRAG